MFENNHSTDNELFRGMGKLPEKGLVRYPWMHNGLKHEGRIAICVAKNPQSKPSGDAYFNFNVASTRLKRSCASIPSFAPEP